MKKTKNCGEYMKRAKKRLSQNRMVDFQKEFQHALHKMETDLKQGKKIRL